MEIVKEIYDVIAKKNISLNDARNIAEIFLQSVNENNEIAVKKYMETGSFEGSPPKN